MALTPRLDLRQSQSLVMTPQLQQAIKLLQLSSLELSAFVEQELETNPLLERADGHDEAEPAPEPAAARDVDEPMLDSIGGQEEPPLDVDYDNTWTADGLDGGDGDTAFANWSGHGGRTDFGDDDSNLERTLSEEISLRDHLIAQINVDLVDPVERMIGLHLVEMVDEAGYLAGDPGEVASRLDCDLELVETVLLTLQKFDPPGIFARSLKECLALQLIDRNRYDPAMAALLDNLELLAKRDFQGLMAACGVDAEDLAEMVAEIRALDPKPALVFDHAIASPVTPDVLMRPAPGGGWHVELNSETLPRLLVDTRYYAKVSKGARDKEEKTYIAECYQTANWLVKSLHQRATTILKVATEIVRQQDAFFSRGVRFLKPLILRDIAEAIEMHESTVSRVTSNKYIATPRGVYELKYFFTPAIASADGAAAHSSEAVRHRIKTMIDAESPGDILSDEMIVLILRKDGVDIARRTVAKYREAMRIPSSVQRRREKTMCFPGG
ncbi:MAG: RNA polymerase factor sigma-54 [Alphaproteobacteria bacterium]|nr:RNA polymerase factor sigma-54 [Alphaproteobacteria bacterium]MBF0129556.1 RNA polymerase factor sigma-54 [Alphaproteobacteria bacterium]